MDKDRDRFQIGRIAIYIFLLVAVFLIFWNAFVKELNRSTEQSLRDVGQQNVLTVEHEFQEQQKLLLGMAQEFGKCPVGEEGQQIVQEKAYIEIYHFKRIGYIRNDGTAYTTDGYIQNLSYRDFYQSSMEGNNVITGVLQDSIGVEMDDINVFSVPVYNEDRTDIRGVLFATYETATLQDMIADGAFDEQGITIIIDENGEIIVSSVNDWFESKDSFFEMVQAYSKDNESAVKQIKKDMVTGESNIVSLDYDKNFTVYYTPVQVDISGSTWYLFTMVPKQMLQERIQPLLVHIILVVGIVIVALIVVSVLSLISRIRGKQELLKLAYEDTLTGGHNYAYFDKKLKKNREKFGYFVSMDISEFKIINNTCGAQKGNVVLRMIWKAVEKNLSKGEEAAHINADHFVFLLLEKEREQLVARLQKITQDIEQISVQEQIPDILPYYGIYINDGMEDVEVCYSRANQAKHLVKGRRDRNYAFYDEVDFSTLLENKHLEDSFEQAIAREMFEVHYQPKFCADTGKIVGAEALIRWRQENGGLISPYKFIPLFEKNGMISRLDEYVFEKVCKDQKQWMEEGKDIIPISANVSRASLHYSGIVDKYQKIVSQYGLPIEDIQIEITESAMIDNTDIQTLVDEFHAAGFTLLLDDFGNGYSSLATLNVLRFDILKIDKSLVDYIGSTDGERLLSCIVELAQNLGFRITAEGVETKEQLEFLQNLHCDDIQGYYFSRPLCKSDFEKML